MGYRPPKGMVYWVWESMGYGHKIIANQPRSQRNLCVTGEYSLSDVWFSRESTVAIVLKSSVVGDWDFDRHKQGSMGKVTGFMFSRLNHPSIVCTYAPCNRHKVLFMLLRSSYKASESHMSWDYHVGMTSLVPDYSTTFYTTSHSDSYYYRD
jgi:hypothetical protein